MMSPIRRGLSLLEVVMAVTLLTGALFTLGVIIPRSVMHLRNKSFETLATQMAERLLEQTRGLDPADIPSGSWDSRDPTPKLPEHDSNVHRQFPPPPYPGSHTPAADVTVQMNGQTVTVRYNFLVEVAPSTPGSPRQIAVTVFWKQPGGDGYETVRNWKVVSEIGP